MQFEQALSTLFAPRNSPVYSSQSRSGDSRRPAKRLGAVGLREISYAIRTFDGVGGLGRWYRNGRFLAAEARQCSCLRAFAAGQRLQAHIVFRFQPRQGQDSARPLLRWYSLRCSGAHGVFQDVNELPEVHNFTSLHKPVFYYKLQIRRLSRLRSYNVQ